MKANELMIGDWVEFIQSDGQGFYAQVEALNDNGTFAESGFFADNMVKPIPLTEELLEKNGFADDYDCEYDMSYEFAIQHPKGGMSAEVTLKHNEDDAEWVAYLFGPKGEVEELTINHVYELQHALRLFGIEKEIIL